MKTVIAALAVGFCALPGIAAAQDADRPAPPQYVQASVGGLSDSGVAGSLLYGQHLRGALSLEGELLGANEVEPRSDGGDLRLSNNEAVALVAVNAVLSKQDGRVRPFVGVGTGLGEAAGNGVAYQIKGGVAVQTFRAQAVTLDARFVGMAGNEDDFSGGAAMLGYRFGFGA